MHFSPLDDRHRALEAKFSEFGGWQMPLEYAGAGVLAEHRAVRDAVGLFDVSHLGKTRITGPGALDYLNACFTNDLAKLDTGQAQYTFCCSEDGGTIDDMLVYVFSPEHILAMPNAANSAEVNARLAKTAPDGIAIIDEHHDDAVLAVQGPNSDAVLQSVGSPTELGYMSFVQTQIRGIDVTVCRSGYTGERGCEIIVPAHSAAALWDTLLMAGAEAGIQVCGLGARDTLRTEMGLSLHGQELSDEITPVMARSSWAIAWDKPTFWGKDALQRQREAKSCNLIRGIQASGRGIPRAGMHIVDDQGRQVGVVTSGTFSPTLKKGIGLALTERRIGFGDSVQIDVRGKPQPFDVVKPPFITTKSTP